MTMRSWWRRSVSRSARRPAVELSAASLTLRLARSSIQSAGRSVSEAALTAFGATHRICPIRRTTSLPPSGSGVAAHEGGRAQRDRDQLPHPRRPKTETARERAHRLLPHRNRGARDRSGPALPLFDKREEPGPRRQPDATRQCRYAGEVETG